MLTRRSALLIPGVLAVSACQLPTLDVRIWGTAEALQISARRDRGLFGLSSNMAPIASATVSTHGAGREETVWEVASAGVCQATVFRIRYGVVPAGFAQRLPPQPLLQHVVYSVSVAGCGGGNGPGLAYFKISDNRLQRLSWQDVS